MLKHLEIGVYNGNAYRPLTTAVLEVIVIMALNKNCQLQIIFRDECVLVSSVTGEIKGDIWTAHAECLTGRRAAAEKEDKSISCLHRKKPACSGSGNKGPKRANAASQIKQMRGFLCPLHILICSSRASDSSYFRLLFLFLVYKKTESCYFDSQHSSTCHYVMGHRWLFNKYLIVYHHLTVNLFLPGSCQVWYVKVLLLSGHPWPPGAVEGQKKKHKAQLNTVESRLLDQEALFQASFCP